MLTGICFSSQMQYAGIGMVKAPMWLAPSGRGDSINIDFEVPYALMPE